MVISIEGLNNVMAYSDDHCIFQNNFHSLLFLQPTVKICQFVRPTV